MNIESTASTISNFDPGQRASMDIPTAEEMFKKMEEIAAKVKTPKPKYFMLKIHASGVKMVGLNPNVCEGLFESNPLPLFDPPL